MPYFNDSGETTLENLQSVFESTDVGYLLLDRELRVLAFNRAMETGYARSIVTELKLNQPFTGELIAEQHVDFGAMLAALQKSDDPVEFEISHTYGEQTRHYSVSIVPVHGADRELIGYCLNATDITPRKIMELERQQIIRDLLARNKDLEQFVFMISHNIRSPLSHIMGLANVLSYDLPEADKRTAVDAILTAAKQLDRALTDTSEIVSMRRQGAERKTLIRLQDMVNEAVSNLYTDITRTGAKITPHFPVVQEVVSIPSYLRSIFLNAISNSIRYAKPDTAPEINISSAAEEDCYAITFSDNGIGLDLAKCGNQLFGLYQRFHGHVEGKGMGLFMVKAQAEIMNGSVEVKSEPDKGFTLILRLPK